MFAESDPIGQQATGGDYTEVRKRGNVRGSLGTRRLDWLREAKTKILFQQLMIDPLDATRQAGSRRQR